jgi:hypothetical protein
VGAGASPRVSVRFSREELEQVRETAEVLGLTVSAFIRATCLGEKLRARPSRVTREAIHQLARVGNNLNQLTHWANTHKHLRSLRELDDILELVREKIEELS